MDTQRIAKMLSFKRVREESREFGKDNIFAIRNTKTKREREKTKENEISYLKWKVNKSH
jgi:hypothetical protein